MKEWNIVSYEGIGPISLNLSLDQVIEKIGSPSSKIKTIRGNSFIFMDGIIKIAFGNNYNIESIGISLNDEIHPTFHNIDIFGYDNIEILKKLNNIEGDVFEAYGILIFKNSGFTISGVHDEDDSQKAVSLFSRARISDFSADMKLIHF